MVTDRNGNAVELGDQVTVVAKVIGVHALSNMVDLELIDVSGQGIYGPPVICSAGLAEKVIPQVVSAVPAMVEQDEEKGESAGDQDETADEGTQTPGKV